MRAESNEGDSEQGRNWNAGVHFGLDVLDIQCYCMIFFNVNLMEKHLGLSRKTGRINYE